MREPRAILIEQFSREKSKTNSQEKEEKEEREEIFPKFGYYSEIIMFGRFRIPIFIKTTWT